MQDNYITEEIWNKILPFLEEAEHWESHDTDFSPHEVFGDEKPYSASAHWHVEALRSTQFCTLPTYAVTAEGIPTFEEIEDILIRTRYQSWYTASMPYYALLKEIALHP